MKDFPVVSRRCFITMALSFQIFHFLCSVLLLPLPFWLWKVTFIKPLRISFHVGCGNLKPIARWLSSYIFKRWNAKMSKFCTVLSSTSASRELTWVYYLYYYFFPLGYVSSVFLPISACLPKHSELIFYK